MSDALHQSIRQAVRDHVAAHGQATGSGMVFDADEVANALLNVLGEVVVSGHPDHVWTFTSRLHTALDEIVVAKIETSQVSYAGPAS